MTRAPGVPSREDLLRLEPTGWPEDTEHEELVGSWRIHQRRRGHRSSTDDVVTAWMAVRVSPGRPSRYLDLGCGTGSVLLLTAHSLRPLYSLGVEAQAESAMMAGRSVADLPETPPIEVLHRDFRELVVERNEAFDLVTGSPPYFPLGTGVLSPDAQRRAARFELRGGVEAYFETTARALTANGSFALVFPTEGDARVLEAARVSRFHLRERIDLFMREDANAPFLTVYGFARAPTRAASSSFAIRARSGDITPEYRAARRELGLL
jgi:tRNA1Val (adenine37-N6)-methyltransferase